MSTTYYHRRLADLERNNLLNSILQQVSARRARPAVVVFDLDGTLIDNRPRVLAILRELSEQWKSRHPDAAALVSTATLDSIVYGFRENLSRLGIGDDALLTSGFEFWKERFFRDAHLRFDIEVSGACAYAWACRQAGAALVYLTGRDLPNMALGSFASLRDLGFPIGLVGTQLVVKPAFEISDTDFKRSVLPELNRVGEVVGAFDNEAANCNLFLEYYPDCTTVLLDTQCGPNPPPLDERISIIHNFER